MANGKDKRNDQVNDPELRANMGQYLKRAKPLSDHNPPKAAMPKAPVQPGQQPADQKFEQQGGTGQGTPPPFPIIPREEISRYQHVKQGDADTFGLEQHGRFDPELNELALKEVAESRGITVEQLLKSNADRKADVKLEAAKHNAEKFMKDQAAPRSLFNEEDTEIARLEQQLSDAKQKKMNQQLPEAQKSSAADLNKRLAEKQKRRDKKKKEKVLEDTKPGVPKEFHDNPVIAKLRKKLSIEAIPPAKVTINDIEFEMLPPPASLSLWILEKIQIGQEVAGDGAPLALTVKIATISAAITKIENTAIEEVLAVEMADGSDELAAKILCAQSLWEMFIGLPSRKELFKFNPDLAVKLYEKFLSDFGEQSLESSFDGEIHRYVCPIPDCMEMYDMREPASGLVPFCKIHGTPTDDKGLIKELRSIPLA